MDPGGSELDSSLPQPENLCLIVEDSQPDSVALEDDPETSYRALLARRLSSLQPAARSPVLELISSPLGSRCSETDSQSESSQNKSQVESVSSLVATKPSSAFQEESQVLHVCPPPNRKECAAENTDMDSGADSTTHGVQTEEGTSQFGFLELSQSQDLRGEVENSQVQDGDVVPQSGTGAKLAAEQKISSSASVGQDDKSAKSEVSSSSSPTSPGPAERQRSAEVLLHSEGLRACNEPEERDCDILSSQDNLFDADKAGVAVDSTVSEPEQKGPPTLSPTHTLGLLHLSGQGTLVQQSLSQSSDYVAPTPDTHTPLIIPSSPTGSENEHGAGEAMDSSLPPDDRAVDKKEGPVETVAGSKQNSSTSTPVSQHSPGVVLEHTLSVPSQPEFSHDVFVPTLSQESPQQSGKKTPSSHQTPSQPLDPAPFTVPLQLSVNTESHRSAQQSSEHIDADSQATQIEDLEDASFSMNVTINYSVEETPCSLSSHTVNSQTSDVREEETDGSAMDEQGSIEEVGAVMEEPEEESIGRGGLTGMALAFSQSQLLSPEPVEEEDSVVVVTDESQVLREDVTSLLKSNDAQPVGGQESTSANGHEPDAVAATDGQMEALKDKSLSDSSGDISFHFTLPKDGELPVVAVGTTPVINQLKQTLRHSTPIEIGCCSEKSDVAMASSDIVPGESAEDKGDGKLSLRMKLVTPVDEGSSEHFSLQKPTLSEDDGCVVKTNAVSKAVSSSSVFSRVRQAHRQQDAEDNDNTSPVRGELFTSPQRNSQESLLGCNSFPNSQSEPSQQETAAAPQQKLKEPPEVERLKERPRPPEASEPPTSNGSDARQRAASQQASSPSSKLRQRAVSQQTGVDAPGLRSTGGRANLESPRKTAGPLHRRHVRTIQEVRTTITRIITDVYYEDGKEVERKVTEETEEPVVDCQVLDSDISPCRTGSSSVTSGDLGDVSSLSSKASSLQHSSGAIGSGAGLIRPDFIMPPSRGPKSSSPRRGGGQQQRGQRAGSVVTKGRGFGTLGSRAFVPLTPRGRARRGRPPSRSSSSRGGGAGSLQKLGAQLLSSSEEEPYTRVLPPLLPVSPTDTTERPSRSNSLRSSPEVASSAGSSFVGLRVVAKWSSNGYFYSGRIIGDVGEGRFRLRFDDGYECEVAGKDILLCDPIPLETEVTALLKDEYFSIGVVKGHKTEGQELFYHVEREGQRQWYSRTSVILSLEQGNRLREQHGLGPYEPTVPLAKASDISLDNLVEGKRRRRGNTSTQSTPNRSSTSSPRTLGPSGKRKLTVSEAKGSPSKRGRRGTGGRAAQRLGVCNTSGSGTDLPGPSCDLTETHGPLPQNASLFMGFAFMLTASSESDQLTNKISSDDDEGEDYVQTGPYNKSYTESQLQAGGGFILPDFNEEQCKAAYQSLLIADQHCRTRKYFLCLASGVPCVSHIWVRDCCKENKLLNYRNYLLPAGMGPDDAMVEWHPRCSPFKGLRVLLVFEKPVEIWSQLITMGGGSSVRHFHTDKDGSDVPADKYDVVVTDGACPPSLVESVKSREVPLVSPEWLIQSLICGERLSFGNRPQFHHNFSL